MVILRNRKLIYIHIHKTGGETVEQSLAQIEKPNDIILDANHPDVTDDFQQRFGLSKHSTAQEVARTLGLDIWGTHFSWATVRNPYARMASFYGYMAAISEPKLSLIGYPLNAAPEAQQAWVESANYRRKDQWAFAGVRAYLATRGSRRPFSDFLRHPLLRANEPAYSSQFSRVSDAAGNALLIKRAVKLESLSDLWPQLCVEMGLPHLKLLTVNETPFRWKRSVADLFVDPADVELINVIHADDFRWFDYDKMGRDPVPRIYTVATSDEMPGIAI
jgi:Sulfotransferase family